MRRSTTGKATVRDVADRAGVSRATVSNVLRGNDGRVSVKTRETVLAAIRELGYRAPIPHSPISKVRAGSYGIMLFQLAQHPLSEHGYYTPILEGCLWGCHEAGQSLNLLHQRAWEMTRADVRTLLDGRVDGVVAVAPLADSSAVHELSQVNFPLVVIGSHYSGDRINCVGTNGEEVGEAALERFLQFGHRRLAYIGSPYQITDCQRRLAGFRRMARRHRLPAIQEWPALTSGEVDAWLEDLAKADPAERVTGIFCFNDSYARRVVETALRLGLRVPNDLSVIGVDGTHEPTPLGPISSFRQPLYEMGREAVSILEQINQDLAAGRPFPVTKRVLGMTPIEGCTLGPAPSDTR
ncbi:MAG: LacI family transcriptional regulator [Fimbriimonadaceae bacterium]|nr:LacI family transcriptional regulator [Fimbriimonadaceae bacterium]